MGSLDRGTLTGFICRLCSEMHRVVLHIYGEEGIRLCISEKINRYLSINVSRSDPLPKTICNNCLDRLENQHRLVMRIEQAAMVLKEQRRPRPPGSRPCTQMCNIGTEGNPFGPPNIDPSESTD